MDTGHPGYFIEPIILKGVPSIIYGDKGVNKTNLCLALIGLVCCGNDDNPMGFKAERANPGMLDWESNRDLTYYNTSRLVEGGTCPYFELPYLRCGLSLCDDVDRISNFITEHKINLVLIDSLGQAAGSDRFDSSGKAGALRFFEVLRRLNVTPLIIAQNAKNEENKKTIFGSTFFTYYARNIFELKDTKSTNNPDEKLIALIHTESNYSRRYNPIGFRVRYTDSTIIIEAQEITLQQLKDRIEDTEAILEFMRMERKLCSVKSIADCIGKSENRTRVVLTILKKRGKIVNPGTGLWGLAEE